MAPIDREDGRHFCDPGEETPGPDGTWTCPGCGTEWTAQTPQGVVVWTRTDDLPRTAALPDVPDGVETVTDGTETAQQNQQEVGDYPPDETLPDTGDDDDEEQG